MVYNLPQFDRFQVSKQQVDFVTTLLTKTQNDVLIAYFQDVRIIDESRIQNLGKELSDLINETSSKRILLNFLNVSFMSSAMIGKLILFEKNCKNADIALRLCNINDNVEQVFKLMRLDKVFKIDQDEETALKNFDKKGWFG